MIFAGAESHGSESISDSLCRGLLLCRCVHLRPLLAVCMYMKSSLSAMLPPARRIAAVRIALARVRRLLVCSSAVCRRRLLPFACRLLSAVCHPLPAACPAGCRRLPARAAALSGISDIAARALFRLLPFSLLSRCPRPLPGRDARKSNGASVVRMRRRWGICLPLFGEFPGSPASVGLGPQP